MKRIRILAACCLVSSLGCDTTPDDPLGHYTYVEPVRDLLPLFAAWDTSLRTEDASPERVALARHVSE